VGGQARHGDPRDAAALRQRYGGPRPPTSCWPFATGQVDGKKLEVVQWRIGGPRDDDIDHVAPGDIKVMHRALGAYLSRRDQVQQAIKMVETERIEDEHGIPFLIAYGISGNTHRFWSIANARQALGYAPEDDSQVNFAEQIARIARAAGKK
jgi:uronate dehydrogenase